MRRRLRELHPLERATLRLGVAATAFLMIVDVAQGHML